MHARELDGKRIRGGERDGQRIRAMASTAATGRAERA
jgi:hypothetical protein